MTNKEWNEQLGLLSPEMRQYVKHCIQESELLECLNDAGVGDWSGYDAAKLEHEVNLGLETEGEEY
jgi:hypothetical protein